MLTIGYGELASVALSTSLILNIFEVIFCCLKFLGLLLLSIVSTCLHSGAVLPFLCDFLFVCELSISF